MELQLGLEIISSYKRLSYTLWYALAEFVDNSTQAYYNNRELLDAIFEKNGQELIVKINYDSTYPDGLITVSDNSIGMTYEELQNSVIIGRPPIITSGRSKYGLGMKTASFWLGNFWSIRTKKLGETEEHFVEVNAEKIANGDKALYYTVKKDLPTEEHYTIIQIQKLNQKFYGRTIDKTKRYLRSMYRKDIDKGILSLFWSEEKLTWSSQELFNRLIKQEGEPLIRNIDFSVDDKRVTGWAGVLAKGSRADAGFSIIQADRVIKGWPSSYRPETLFGPQEGGSNDLVNQRLVGELYLDGFDVSHTKDEVLFKGDEQELLEAKLQEQCGDLRALALRPKNSNRNVDERQPSNVDFKVAIQTVEEELSSTYVETFLNTFEIPDEEVIKGANEIVIKSVEKRTEPTFDIMIGGLRVKLYIDENMSPYEPYVLIQSTAYLDKVIVILNRSHPYWSQLSGVSEIVQFIRQCAYDGVAEWKAYSVTHKFDPDTIKLIKDNLLRLSYKVD
ncbi:ATP-binding protein [Spirosoma montaniterrae]|uniref:ATP-binding protein n=1 Tax=Spirosoma montaniterrae TaxID=1178516 RepID=A0A1P9WX13_9BACT|nr:ATP-binding protein [Spirosoma montaniterrae]AQG79932.1 hypothetical protein AWR27_11715 [Spirosoma montaniterrae]